ncbi:MAG: alanine--tRNA ligase [Clostridiales bacterium]|nr:alanine--tRNA ligase [Clostridiales bacterium]
MQWTSVNDLREKFLSFFESKGHLRLPSFSLIPQDDKSLLLINAGMAPMKKYFTGEVEPPRHRVCTCQKCIRTPDLERVGHTARHGTYFEMLGNFSFGDYFKKEAIPWAWEFLTVTLEIPPEKLFPSVYTEDDEAFDLWNKVIGVPAERITRLGKEDNFWEHGTGPCGPCSEIYFDRGEKYGCGRPDCKPGCDCDRYMEIWNNVFTQFNRMSDGTYETLEHKNIDTGMGLERLACVMQGVDNMFEVDGVRKILDKVVEISGKAYGENQDRDVSIRVITDHVRGATFMISDGVIPSNEGRGYVLRRILRRAARHGKLLGIDREFLTEVCDVVIRENVAGYPELGEKADYIKKVMSMEEDRFNATIDAGLSKLNELIADAKANGKTLLSGDDSFRLYDTYGFPVDLTREIAEEAGLELDDARFAELMKEQRDRARAARADISGWAGTDKTALASLPATEFTGYSETKSDAKVLAILTEEGPEEEISEGECMIVLDRTPFYGESGGQVGDIGTISAQNVLLTVEDTKKTDGVYLHHATVQNGLLKVGDTVTAEICAENRDDIRRNHTAAHLMQAALRRILGTHVEQAGQLVNAERMRFDFTHFAALTAEEVQKVESLVNDQILAALPVTTVETDMETAKKEGAMALFGEKYGAVVRMVKMGDFSTELCGGTHCANTANVGLFKIVSESSVAAGVRRIEAVTGRGVLALIHEKDAVIGETAKALKAGSAQDMPVRAAALNAEISRQKKEIDALNQKIAASRADSLLAEAVQVNSVRLITADLGDAGMDSARALCDKFKDKYADIAVVLAVRSGGKLNFVGAAGADAVKAGAHAGKLLGAVAAVTGGKGGGRPDSATSGGKDLSKTADALAAAKDILAGMVK